MDQRFEQTGEATGLPNGGPSWCPNKVDCIVKGAKCVVFDFYNTLSSDLFFGPLGEQVLARIQPLLWGKDQQMLDRWMTGQVTATDICAYLAVHLAMPAEHIEWKLREGCRKLAMNRAVLEFAHAVRAAGKRTALVTVNMDVFSEDVVPGLGLDQVFEVILNSADHGTLDKTELWPIAFDRLGGGLGYANSFLIEDGTDSPAKFSAAEGTAFQYVDDAGFMAWLSAESE